MRAYVDDVSATGNLTVRFSKPIIVPPILTKDQKLEQTNQTAVDSSEAQRQLESLEDGGKDDEFYYEIEDIIGLRVQSDFFIDESDAIKISRFWLTRITEQVLEVSIDFLYPTNITQSIPDPDNLVITFKNPLVFID